MGAHATLTSVAWEAGAGAASAAFISLHRHSEHACCNVTLLFHNNTERPDDVTQCQCYELYGSPAQEDFHHQHAPCTMYARSTRRCPVCTKHNVPLSFTKHSLGRLLPLLLVVQRQEAVGGHALSADLGGNNEKSPSQYLYFITPRGKDMRGSRIRRDTAQVTLCIGAFWSV